MLADYHMHFEYGSYDEEWVKGFFDAAKKRGVSELGISEHSHGFKEFEELYYEDLILDDSFIGEFQKKWLKTNKFKCYISDYEKFINELKGKGYPVKFGMEICNFQNQNRVKKILDKYNFDYLITSIHFIEGWAYDSSQIKKEWDNKDIYNVYEKYVEEIEKVAKSGLYDILGHPFNLRMYGYFPKEDMRELIERAVLALKNSNMAVDVNTGTLYRYPIKEISPYNEFMKMAKRYDLPIILSSDAHKPEDAGNYIKQASEYAKSFGYSEYLRFENRKRIIEKL
ncbi:histidinol-phosphatase [Haliovirga abyssi]|uniref:Histidinol-phosphatase n=1 Tax=Haliovirga abyssi TaxID=2996794 RepID=A0AAU9D889_9FUSO|nr:histidinol-phosphatase [Haliovirga abyssi]BDU50808.1 histidinol-phosphatase [Haliovirga abyssi]